MRFPAAGLAALMAAGAVLGGCAAPLPTYPWTDQGAALDVLSQRARGVRTVSATGTIVLSKSDGSPIHLDAAVAAEVPGRLRVRAWKFGHVAFDLTLTPDGLWVLTGDDAPADAEDSLAGLTSDRFAEAWGLFTGDFFGSDAPHVVDSGGRTFIVSRAWNNDGATVACVVDRATLTPQRYEVLEKGGAVRQSLELARYRQVSGIVWPLTVAARGPSGFMVLDLDEVEINTELAPGAFNAPARAVKRR